MAPTAQPSKGTILVVDDDRLVLAMLAHGLSRAGYDVIDADNGDDAILLAREHHPQLALLDIRMQGKSGFDVAAYLRGDSCRIPFIFLSAFADAQTVAQVKALGALAYLVKPLDVDQILPVVAEAFASLASRRDLAKADPRTAVRAAPTPDVLMAVGVLMHRHSLVRAAAFERLQHLAVAENLTVAEQAARVIEAIERLALPAST